MIAEVETDVLPSLRIQSVGSGSVIASLGNPRMAVKQPLPFAHGADGDRGGLTVGGHGCLSASTRTSQGPSRTRSSVWNVSPVRMSCTSVGTDTDAGPQDQLCRNRSLVPSIAVAPVEVIVAGSSYQGWTKSMASHWKSDLAKLESGMVPTHVT